VAGPNNASLLRDFIYLDTERVQSLASQLDLAPPDAAAAVAMSHATVERLYLQLEPRLLERSGTKRIGSDFDFAGWTPDAFVDGQFVHATGVVRLLDFAWLSAAMGGLPAVLKKMSKLEMEALRNSEEGRRMSKSQIQQRSQENQVAIGKVEEMKADELGDVVSKLYGEVVRIKVRPNPASQPGAAIIGSAQLRWFYDPPAALSQKYGVEIDANWISVGQLNVPKMQTSNPVPTGNRMEDAFEQIALLMNNAFRMASAPAFPAVSFTPIAVYRTTNG
jgi:hypothetical protein